MNIINGLILLPYNIIGQATYAIANFDGASATLCQLCPRRFLDKWVQLKVECCTLKVNQSQI